MKRFGWLVVVGVGLLGAAVACGQERGQWRALSSTARAITGDVAISGDKVTINFATFTIAQIRKLQPEEVGAVFNPDAPAVVGGNLYRLNVPGTLRFLHKNTLCGSENTQWMVTYASGKMLQVAFFSGEKMPVFTAEAIGASTELCGTFTYAR